MIGKHAGAFVAENYTGVAVFGTKNGDPPLSVLRGLTRNRDCGEEMEQGQGPIRCACAVAVKGPTSRCSAAEVSDMHMSLLQ